MFLEFNKACRIVICINFVWRYWNHSLLELTQWDVKHKIIKLYDIMWKQTPFLPTTIIPVSQFYLIIFLLFAYNTDQYFMRIEGIIAYILLWNNSWWEQLVNDPTQKAALLSETFIWYVIWNRKSKWRKRKMISEHTAWLALQHFVCICNDLKSWLMWSQNKSLEWKTRVI